MLNSETDEEADEPEKVLDAVDAHMPAGQSTDEPDPRPVP